MPLAQPVRAPVNAGGEAPFEIEHTDGESLSFRAVTAHLVARYASQ